MADVLVRGLAPDVVARLKSRARENGRSLQVELKAILEYAARPPLGIPEAIKRVRAMHRGRRFGDSTVLIREDRDR
jgi:antitoxin FitA